MRYRTKRKSLTRSLNRLIATICATILTTLIRKKKEEDFAVKWEVGEDNENSSSGFVSLMRIVVTLKRLRYFAMKVENEPR